MYGCQVRTEYSACRIGPTVSYVWLSLLRNAKQDPVCPIQFSDESVLNGRPLEQSESVMFSPRRLSVEHEGDCSLGCLDKTPCSSHKNTGEFKGIAFLALQGRESWAMKRDGDESGNGV
jgi:hypothetical protein